LVTRGRTAAAREESQREQSAKAKPAEQRVEDRLAEKSKGGDLLERVQRVRHQMAQELGIILPKVRIRDNVRLEPRDYRIKIRDVPVASGTIYTDRFLAMDTGMARGKVTGIDTREPAFEMPAVWVDRPERERAELLGYTVVEPTSVLATHLSEVIRKHADELLTRDQVKQLLENLKATSPAVVEEVVPSLLKTGDVQKVLANLLRERVPIRHLETILESLGDYAGRTADADILTEYVRHSLSRVLCQQLRDDDGKLYVVTLDPALEDFIAAGVEHTERGLVVKLAPASIEAVVRALGEPLKKLTAAGHRQVALCNPAIRAALKRMTTASLPHLACLSFNEVTRDTQVESIALVSLPASQE
jgi:flagellar biosynthesis protein FlhA